MNKDFTEYDFEKLDSHEKFSNLENLYHSDKVYFDVNKLECLGQYNNVSLCIIPILDLNQSQKYWGLCIQYVPEAEIFTQYIAYIDDKGSIYIEDELISDSDILESLVQLKEYGVLKDIVKDNQSLLFFKEFNFDSEQKENFLNDLQNKMLNLALDAEKLLEHNTIKEEKINCI